MSVGIRYRQDCNKRPIFSSYYSMAKFTEKQLISKLQELRQIKPSDDWVVFTKNRIFAAETETRVSVGFSFIAFLKELQRGERFVFRHKPVFAFALSVLILIGVFGFAQNSVPGDTLFSIKKITEKGQAVFVFEKDQAKHNFEMAGKRLDDLTKIAQENEVKNLASAINEYQESVFKAAESLAEMESVKEIVEEIKKLEEGEENVKSLGIEIGKSEELDNALAKIVETEIKDLERKTLSEEKQEILAEVKQDYEAGNYYDALEKILLLINN